MTPEKIIYVSQTDIQDFLAGDCASQGFAYEWEGEDVVHLRLAPLAHAFGKASECMFVDAPSDTDKWQLVCQEDGIYALFNGERYGINLIPSHDELYSRSKGILEVGILQGKHVAIVGLGSFGSQIAVELAKAGVGEFSLLDFDRVELHNLARHTCGLNDLGRLKTDAIEDAIKGKNPYAKVNKYPVNINDNQCVLADVMEKADLIICATDNNISRYTIAEHLHRLSKTCIFGRAITRAEGGDVFISRPGEACYCCLVGNDWFETQNEEITNEQSARRDGTIAAYVAPEDADAMVQVGLSSDISPICNMMIKLALIELSKGQNSGISSLEDELTYNYYMWANRRERKYANWHNFTNAGPYPTIMRWYGANIQKRDECAVCSRQAALDLGEAYEGCLQDTDMSDINIDELLDFNE